MSSQAGNRSSSARPLFWLLLAVCLIGIVSMPRQEYPADPLAVRCETVSLINHGALDVPDVLVRQYGGEPGQFFCQNPVNHKWFSKYGILNSLIYLPPLLLEKVCENQASLPYFSRPRALYLNLFNVALAMATAAYLYLIVRRHTGSAGIAATFVLTAFYCTYWWNYLRAQRSEIYEVLFMLAFFHHLTSWFDAARRSSKGPVPAGASRELLYAGIFIGALVLAKTVYVLLAPIALLFTLGFEWRRLRPEPGENSRPPCGAILRTAAWIAAPIGCAIVILLAVNAFKFGSPFESGYGQWKERGQPIFSGHFLSGATGFLFSPHYSIFLHFPILLFAVFGYRRFFKEHRIDAWLMIIIGAVLFCVNSKLLQWKGGWSYGPRYMMAILPLLSLPFACTIQFVAANRRKWRGAAPGVLMAAILLYSLVLQLNVNALPFFAYFHLRDLFGELHNPEMDSYFDNNHLGKICGDLLAYKDGGSWRVLEIAAPALGPQKMAVLKANLQRHLVSNYYFWPEPITPPQPK